VGGAPWRCKKHSLVFFKTQGLPGRYRERLVRLEATLKVFMDQTDDHLFIDLGGYLYPLTGVVRGFAYWDRRAE